MHITLTQNKLTISAKVKPGLKGSSYVNHQTGITQMQKSSLIKVFFIFLLNNSMKRMKYLPINGITFSCEKPPNRLVIR